jgi:transcriptional regulator with XRE-family HTH domain
VNLLYHVGKCRLGYLLKSRKITQQELAKKIGLTKQQISQYINNEIKMSYNTAYIIAKELNVPMESLYEWK